LATQASSSDTVNVSCRRAQALAVWELALMESASGDSTRRVPGFLFWAIHYLLGTQRLPENGPKRAVFCPHRPVKSGQTPESNRKAAQGVVGF
jgi:hypothetical protein